MIKQIIAVAALVALSGPSAAIKGSTPSPEVARLRKYEALLSDDSKQFQDDANTCDNVGGTIGKGRVAIYETTCLFPVNELGAEMAWRFYMLRELRLIRKLLAKR